jgi:hypothetical protein
VSDLSATAPQNLLAVNDSLSIPRSELDVRVSRSSTGGQRQQDFIACRDLLEHP